MVLVFLMVQPILVRELIAPKVLYVKVALVYQPTLVQMYLALRIQLVTMERALPMIHAPG